MNRLFSLTIAIALTISIVFLAHHFNPANKKTTVFVSRVIDGDTIVIGDGRHVRFLDINAPEHTTPISNLSINFMKKFQGKNISAEIIGTGKYGRTLAKLYNGSQYINLEEVKKGYVSKYTVDNSELKLFSDAESEAIKQGKGIWKKSKYYGCLKPHINPTEEFITFKNNCSKINLDDWKMKDESRKTFTFPNISIFKGETITIFSTSGKSNSTTLFWNSSTPIWNNDRDSMYLFDNNWRFASYETYGYANDS